MDALGFVLVAIAALAATYWSVQQLRRPRPQHRPVPDGGGVPEISGALDQIVIGDNESAPMVRITPLARLTDLESATPIRERSGSSVGRFNALMQAVPSLAVFQEAAGKTLMEVSIRGDLVRAADGVGLRAFAREGGRISENARLFDAEKLEGLIDKMALWQIASVLVAQKHLADINRNLEELKEGVSAISRFLDTQRKARIRATYRWLEQISEAIAAGELPAAARLQLERAESELLEIQEHLTDEYRQIAGKKVEHTEAFGTETLAADIERKLRTLDELAHDLYLTVMTRVAAWHVLSLYPGEPALKLSRRKSIEEAIPALTQMSSSVQQDLLLEIMAMNSFWTSGRTQAARTVRLLSVRQDSIARLELQAQRGHTLLSSSVRALDADETPIRFLVEFKDGKPCGARELL